MSGRGRGGRGGRGRGMVQQQQQPTGPSGDTGFTRGRGGGHRGGFQHGASSSMEQSSISSFKSYEPEAGSIQGHQDTGFGNAQSVGFDAPPRRGGGARGRGGGRGTFERNGGGGFGGGGGPGFGGGGGGGAGFEAAADKDDFGRPRNPTADYGGQKYTEDDLFGEKNLSVSGIDLSKQDELDVKVSDFCGGDNPITAESCRRNTFEEMDLAPQLMHNIKRLKWTKPTPVQKHACSILLDGRDVMASAQTGSGKTGAMLIPMINYLINQESVPKGGQCQEVKGVIVAPTRELATQIYADGLKLANGTSVKINVAYGGTATRQNMRDIWNGTSILIGTPGRLADFLEKRVYVLKECEFFFLDEADRMLDMGFKPQIEELTRDLPEAEMRTMALFSATMPTEIQKMGSQMLNEYVFISVGVVGAANEDVDQQFFVLDRKQKLKKCAEIITQLPSNEKILVFVGSKIFADTMAGMLSEQQIRSTALHGDRCQEDRDRAIREFKNGTHRVLVATSVAARGLDVKDISTVVNYDMPQEISEYIHRIGRTARIGNKGRAITFLDAVKDRKHIGDLINILKDAKKPIPDVLATYGGGSGYRAGGDSHWGNGGGGGRQAEDHREYASFDGANARGPVDCAPVASVVKTLDQNDEEDDW